MNLPPQLFWDTDYEKIDWDKKSEYVISRVLDRGSLKDWFEIKRYYGIEKIVDVVKNARYLSKKTVYFMSNVFDIPLEEIRCYKLMQSQPEQWIF